MPSRLMHMSSLPSPQETEFLETLNQHLPKGVDWKQGALDYIANVFAKDNGEVAKRFHLIKPFHSVYPIDAPINLQMTEFVREVAHFLNVLAMMQLDHDAKFLDVACGSGWLSHFLTKLRIQVTGIDISPDMIALAQERLAHDPIRTVDDNHFNAKFFVHDMEEGPLKIDSGFDVAVLESALHHFVNPIQTLRNIADSLNDRGIVVILEAASDGRDAHQIDIMQQFNTLERPYTREQLIQILQFAGFQEYQFLYPVNGFFPQTAAVADALRSQVLFSQNWNTVVMAKQVGVLAKRLQIQSPHVVESPHVAVPNAAVSNAAVSAPIATPPSVTQPAPMRQLSHPTPASSASGELGLKGELQILASTTKRIFQKTIVKLTGRQPN